MGRTAAPAQFIAVCLDCAAVSTVIYMDITSFVYLIFVAVSLAIYWIMPKGRQWFVLLADSLIFYFINAKLHAFLYLLISVITVWLATNYFAGSSGQRKKKIVLIGTVALNMGMLAVPKGTNLAIYAMNFILDRTGGAHIAAVSWMAALGISFYILQIVAYLLDAYWGVTEIERNPAKLLLFTCYFPLMISGPINTHDSLHPQLFAEHRFNYDDVTHGMKRIAWGLIKKNAISNRLAIIVNDLWDSINATNGVLTWVAVIGYVFQLYTDFSGCMDIVIGVSECFGIRLAENFKAPLLAKTTQEFWQRWHITLGRWLRDYIMNPLLKSSFMIDLGGKAKKKFGKKRGKKVPVYLSMLAVWFVMGAWHGGSWKYVMEGLWFWVVLVLSQMLEPTFKGWKAALKVRDGLIWKIYQVIRTNLIYAVGVLFFRAASTRDALLRIKQSTGMNVDLQIIKSILENAAHIFGKSGCFLSIIAFIMLFIYDLYLYRGIDLIVKISEKNFAIRWTLYALVIFIICTSYNNVSGEAFVYAHF